jgi:hypothetical protein
MVWRGEHPPWPGPATRGRGSAVSAQLKPLPMMTTTRERPAHVQTALTGAVYSYLLRDCLELYESDARLVEKRYGLPPDVQHQFGYRSSPQPIRLYQERVDRSTSQRLDTVDDVTFFDWFTFTKEALYPPTVRVPVGESTARQDALELALAERFGEIEGIPGLYVDDRLHAKLPRSGLLVPCRVDTIPRALLSYPRADEGKTFWFTSNGLNGGAPARASLHVVNQHRGERERVVVVVAHTIEADALAWESGECVVAVNGLSPLRVVRELGVIFSELKGCMISLADSDRLARTLREHGLRVRVEETEVEHES